MGRWILCTLLDASDGLSIIAMPATLGKSGRPDHRQAVGPLRLLRARQDLVITEFGIVDLRGKPSTSAPALIDIASPEHRDRLLVS